jgi:hypothetical protein
MRIKPPSTPRSGAAHRPAHTPVLRLYRGAGHAADLAEDGLLQRGGSDLGRAFPVFAREHGTLELQLDEVVVFRERGFVCRGVLGDAQQDGSAATETVVAMRAARLRESGLRSSVSHCWAKLGLELIWGTVWISRIIVKSSGPGLSHASRFRFTRRRRQKPQREPRPGFFRGPAKTPRPPVSDATGSH